MEATAVTALSPELVYRVLTVDEWQEMLAANEFTGTDSDKHDGFIHLSARAQVADTIATHFVGRSHLVILEIDASSVRHELRWQLSRGGALFPHLYGKLPLSAVLRTIEPEVFTRSDSPRSTRSPQS